MAYKVLFSAEARVELEVAHCFFRTKDLATLFLKDFSHQLKFLETTPLSFQKRYREVRIILFKEFNYSIHYMVKEDTVLILKILNQRQHF